MTGPTAEPLPDDIDALKALIVAQRAALRLAEARAATAENEARARGLEIEKLRHMIARLRHERCTRPAKTAEIVVDCVRRDGTGIYAAALCGGCLFQFHGNNSAMRLVG